MSAVLEPTTQRERRFYLARLPFQTIAAWSTLGLVLVLGVPLFVCLPVSVNVAYFDSCARAVLAGAEIRREGLHHGVLPGMFWLQTALRAVIGWRTEALRIVDLASVGLCIVLLVRPIQTSLAAVAARVWTAVLLLFVYLASDPTCHCEPDIWMMLPALVALTLRQRQLSPRMSDAAAGTVFRCSFLEGACWGLAFWLKPFIAAPAFAVWFVFGAVVAVSRPRNMRRLRVELAGLVLGGVVILALGFGEMAWSGALGHLLAHLGRGESFRNPATFAERLARMFLWALPLSLIHLVAIPLALAEMIGLVRAARTTDRDELHVWPGLLAAFYLGWLLQASFLQFALPYHYEPPLLMGLALVAGRLWNHDPGRWRLAYRCGLVVCVVGAFIHVAVHTSTDGDILVFVPIVGLLAALIRPGRSLLGTCVASGILLTLCYGPFASYASSDEAWMLLMALAALALRMQTGAPAGFAWLLPIAEGFCCAGAIAAVPGAIFPITLAWVASAWALRSGRHPIFLTVAAAALGFAVLLTAQTLHGGIPTVIWLERPAFVWYADLASVVLFTPRTAMLLLLPILAVPLAATELWRNARVKRRSDEPTAVPVSPSRVPEVMVSAFLIGWLLAPDTLARQFYFSPVVLLLAAVVVLHHIRSFWSLRAAALGVYLLAAAYPLAGFQEWRAPALLRPNYVAAWTDCWRDGSTPGLRDRLTRGSSHLRVRWQALADVKEYLQTQGPPSGNLVCFHTSTGYLLSETGWQPASTNLMIEPGLCILPPAPGQAMVDEFFERRPRYLVGARDEVIKVNCPRAWVVFESAPYFVVRMPASGARAEWYRPDTTVTLEMDEQSLSVR